MWRRLVQSAVRSASSDVAPSCSGRTWAESCQALSRSFSCWRDGGRATDVAGCRIAPHASAAAAGARALRTNIPGPTLPVQSLQWRPYATVVERQQAANPDLKFWKPTSPGQRGRATVRRPGIWRGGPMRALVRGAARTGGRNNRGRITCRHRGGGHKKVLRQVDFWRKTPVAGVVERLEYDPGRSGYIALVRYPAAELKSPVDRFAYMLAPQHLAPGDTVAAGSEVPIRPGNCLPLAHIPVGMPIHSIELQPGRGGQLCRAAGCMATIVNKQQTHAIVRLPSGEQRLVHMSCRATIGAVSNPHHGSRVLGKAGYARHLGRRPTVRGVAMNAVDHPHGGGTAGGRPSCSPWGIPTKGFKTRNKRKASSKFILVTRHQAQRRS